jgi:uncharacterized surface protein with fasciclin (FAS1) repeats
MKKFTIIVTIFSLFALGFTARGDGHEQPTIVEIAAGNASFSTLVAAVVKTDLLDTLNGKRQFTVFAPTNSAFDDLAGGEGQGILLVNSLDADTLKSILLYHVAPGERFSEDVVAADRIRTMSKQFIGVDEVLEGLVLADVDASNGVVHVIDFVLIPPAE